MRRILAIETISQRGGAQCSLAENLLALQERFPASFFAAVPHGPLFERLKAGSVPLFAIAPFRLRRRNLLTLPFRLLKTRNDCKRAIRAVHPDYLLANSLNALLCVSGLGLPCIWHIRDLRIPPPLLRWAVRHATHIIAISQAVADAVLAVFPAARQKITILSNGIDTHRFRPANAAIARQRHHLPANNLLIGMVAHFVPWKNHLLFLQAAALLHKTDPHIHFVLAGGDLLHEHNALLKKIKSEISRLQLENVIHLCGETSQPERLYPALHLLVHPAINEPFGRVICEAMACGIPVIACAPGGPAEILENEKNGILLKDPNAMKIADAIRQLLSNPTWVAELRQKGRETVLSKFSTTRVVADLETFFNALPSPLGPPR